jgi:diadenylate cyclase
MDWSRLIELWRPTVEITILTVVIYHGYNFVRTTRAAPAIAGVFLLLALMVITSVLKLEVLNWLLRALFAVSTIAVLVIFQPELRRVLTELGNLSLRNVTRERRENIEVIINTVERLADVHIGALIAIEQTIPVHEDVESGIAVDCEATPEMLETIFFPNNAIHDGGVIIKGNRISHAACIFPLTARKDLSKSMGTRHRAAIGLSEETDAVVVAVSEETGAISYAYKGQFVRGVTLEVLRAFLTSVLVPATRARTWSEAFKARLEQFTKTRPDAAQNSNGTP